jgi:hypothetical protein
MDESANKTLKNAERLIRDFMEHNDVLSARVFITVKHSGQCGGMNTGSGDWYSTYGYIKEWLIREDEKTRLQVRPDTNTDEEKWK